MKKQTDNKQVQELKAKVGELTNDWKRALADYKNLEQRVREQKGEWAKMAEVGVIAGLLPVLDDLSLAAKHNSKNKGIKMIKDRFLGVLKEMGVAEIDPTGQEYDPMSMECAEAVPGAKDKVIKTVFPGYKIYGKIIRVAKVAVGNGKGDANDAN